jgi:hypothetical protein
MIRYAMLLTLAILLLAGNAYAWPDAYAYIKSEGQGLKNNDDFCHTYEVQIYGYYELDGNKSHFSCTVHSRAATEVDSEDNYTTTLKSGNLEVEGDGDESAYVFVEVYATDAEWAEAFALFAWGGK